uniref:Uncharacterized protein n=1 Tax=Pipistrellus kuhlii TaxID=59472 RepID=A0A7J7WLH1_PIPKU|nr:hypothetical protein mPipKuh1_007947 [Pipistrellus kuhlii]
MAHSTGCMAGADHQGADPQRRSCQAVVTHPEPERADQTGQSWIPRAPRFHLPWCVKLLLRHCRPRIWFIPHLGLRSSPCPRATLQSALSHSGTPQRMWESRFRSDPRRTARETPPSGGTPLTLRTPPHGAQPAGEWPREVGSRACRPVSPSPAPPATAQDRLH